MCGEVFGVLFKQFAILALPGRLWFSEEMSDVAKACCILHNMTVEHRRSGFTGDGIGNVREEHVVINEGFTLTPISATTVMNATSDSASLKDKKEHYRLQNALVDYIWNEHGSVQ